MSNYPSFYNAFSFFEVKGILYFVYVTYSFIFNIIFGTSHPFIKIILTKNIIVWSPGM